VKKFVAVAAAAGFVAAGVVLTPLATAAPAAPQGAQQQASSYNPPPVAWGACADPRLARRGAECGFVVVPLDYDKPNGTTINLAVSRIKHKTPDAQAQGPMLVNPGGPGGSGLIYAVFGEFVPNGAGDSYDWIGFDPRGVGSSEPALSCIPDYNGYNRPFYLPVTQQLERTWMDRSKSYADACTADNAELLKHIKTVDTVKDMDSIRKALGAPQINFYGFSYGTYLGQVYGTLFPDKLRRAIFDGTVNPKRVWYDANIDQDIAFEKSIKIYFDWVARHNDVYNLGSTAEQVEQLYYREQLKLINSPAAGVIGPDEWNDLFLQAGYYVYGWTDVADAFAAWVHDRNPDGLVALYGGPEFDDNGYAIYLGVECTDAQWPTNWNYWRASQWLTWIKAPFVTWGNAWFNAPCVYWSAKAGTPVKVDGSKVQSVLMINETFDGATPYSGSLEVRKLFPNAVLIEGVNGTTHSGSLSGIACTDDRIAAYLATGALPARQPGSGSDVQCDPVPQPEPAGAVARTASADSTTGADTPGDRDLRIELQSQLGRP